MFRIELLSMPFAAVNYPSLALTQLKYIIEERFHDKADIHIRYINHDFARHIGYKIYLDIAENGTPSKSDLELDNYNDIGLKEWMFRQIAFPDTRDNAYEYWNEFLHYEPDKIKKILQIRSRIKPILLKIIEEYDLAHSNIVGFCSMFDQQLASLAMAQLLKEENPEIITLMGGCSCEYPAGQEISKQCKSIDYIFSGQAYQSFPELVGMLLEGKRDIPVAIPGVFCKHQQHSAAQTQKKFRYGNADTELDITNLDYDAFFASLDSNLKNENVQPVLFFETSRGCLWAEKKRCTFCDVNRENKKYKIMHPQKLLKCFKIF